MLSPMPFTFIALSTSVTTMKQNYEFLISVYLLIKLTDIFGLDKGNCKVEGTRERWNKIKKETEKYSQEKS